MGETGNIFETSQVGKKNIIAWNIDYVFYKKLLLKIQQIKMQLDLQTS